MLLSFIIPVFNAENYIERTLESIYKLNMYFNEFEVIVINDGSTDNSEKILLKYYREKNNFRYFKQCNKGAAESRNFGIKQSRGKFIQFVDSDDYLLKKDFPFIINFLYSNSSTKIDIIALNGYVINENTEGSLKFNFLYSQNLEFLSMTGEEYILTQHFLPSPCVYIFSTNFLLSNNLFYFNTRSCEDIDHTIISIYKAKNIIYINKAFYIICPRPDSLSRNITMDFALNMLNSILRGVVFFGEENRFLCNYYLKMAVIDWLIFPLKILINNIPSFSMKEIYIFYTKAKPIVIKILSYKFRSSRYCKQYNYLLSIADHGISFLWLNIIKKWYLKIKSLKKLFYKYF